MGMERWKLRKEPREGGAARRTWRDSPVVVAAISAAASMSLMATVGIPLATGYLTGQVEALRTDLQNKSNEIRDLNDVVERLRKEVSTRGSAIEAEKHEIRRLKNQMGELQMSNLFLPGHPYVRGLDKVQLGSNQETVVTTYGEEAIEKADEDYWSVKVDHKVYSLVTYYFDSRPDERRVTHILHHFDERSSGIDPAVIGQLLLGLFGKPFQRDHENQLWVMGNKVMLNLRTDGNLIIYAPGIYPQWLTRLFEREAREKQNSANSVATKPGKP